MAEQQDKDLWLIVIRGESAYLGTAEGTKESVLECVDNQQSFALNSFCKVIVDMMPTPQGVARHLAAYPFLNTLGGAPLHIVADAVQFLDEMQPADKQRYKTMADKAASMAQGIRAQESGLTLPGQMPGDGQSRA
jgi:hypothetical protein